MPGLEEVLKRLILGLILIVASVGNGAVAIPLGLLLACKLLRTKTKAVRIATGVVIAIGLFLALWLGEIVVVAIFADMFLVPKK